jgi:hypothetical protein
MNNNEFFLINESSLPENPKKLDNSRLPKYLNEL